MKTPPDPEDVAEALRERIKKEDLTLTASEAVRIIWMLERLSQRCGEAYQVVGQLADHAGLFHDPAVIRTMDLLAFPLRPGEILPFHPEPPKSSGEKQRRKPKRVSKKGKRKTRA